MEKSSLWMDWRQQYLEITPKMAREDIMDLTGVFI